MTDPHQGYEWIAVRKGGSRDYYHIPTIRTVKIAREPNPKATIVWHGKDEPEVLTGQAALDVIEYIEKVVSRVFVAGDPTHA